MAPQYLERRAPVVDENTFAFITELEVRKAVRLQYYVSLLGIKVDVVDDRTAVPRSVNEQLAHMISTEIRCTDLVCPFFATSDLHILLLNVHLYNLPIVMQRITRLVNRHLFKVDDQLRELSLSMGGACFPSTARGREDLFTQVLTLMSEAQRDRSERHPYRLAATSP
jgi:hypothetical protein